MKKDLKKISSALAFALDEACKDNTNSELIDELAEALITCEKLLATKKSK